ncbi:putative small nuclear ribonucleoprotein-associated protein B [Fusarium oxysporum f. sp. albedinis]|nr:putative small nuclear ribonucleoprotein-associated protein B [Fusarium oxysporum f. sp. albedinis]
MSEHILHRYPDARLRHGPYVCLCHSWLRVTGSQSNEPIHEATTHPKDNNEFRIINLKECYEVYDGITREFSDNPNRRA